MGRGSADEVVKPEADEGMVTFLRVKLSVSGRNAGGEGRKTGALNFRTETKDYGLGLSLISFFSDPFIFRV